MSFSHLHPQLAVLFRGVSDHADIPAPATAGDFAIYYYIPDDELYAKDSANAHVQLTGTGGGGGGITSVVGGDNISVDVTDPDNPEVNLDMTGSLDMGNQGVNNVNHLQLAYDFGGSFGTLSINDYGYLSFVSDDVSAAVVGATPTVTALANDAQALAHATFVDITLQSADGGFATHFDQSDTTKLIVDGFGAARQWKISAFVVINCQGGGAIGTICECEVRVNGTSIARASKAMDGNTSTQLQTFPIRVSLTDADEITVAVKQNSGSTVNLHSSLTDAWSGLTLEAVQ